MRQAWLVLLLMGGALAPRWLPAAPNSEALLELLRAGRFTALASATDLPLAVLRVCVEEPEQGSDPGGPTRFLWAATDGTGHYVADLEYGGRGHHQTVHLISVDSASHEATLVAVADGEQIASIDDLLRVASETRVPFWREPGR